MEQILKEWDAQMNNFHLPRWIELPDMELYMDQVISQLDKYLAPMQSDNSEHFVTASMVNNYVKQQLLPAPVKKRYSRLHMAHLVLICILKQVLTIPEVKILLNDNLTSKENETDVACAYDAFCASQESAFIKVAQIQNSLSCDSGSCDLALDATVLACAGKTLAQKLIRETQNS